MNWLFAALLCHVAWSDLARRRIPNVDVWLLLATGGAMAVSGHTPFAVTPQLALAGAVAALLGTLPFYAARWMGAGDVKLCTALGACVGWQALLPVWMVSLLVAVAYGAVWRCVAWRPQAALVASGGAVARQKVVPYGAALCMAVAVLWVLRWQAGALVG